MAAEYIVEVSNKYKIGNIRLDMERGNVYVHVETSFRDEAVSKETFEKLEEASYFILCDTYDDIQQIARGDLFKSNEHTKMCRLKQLLEHANEPKWSYPDVLEEDDEDGIEDITDLLASFVSLLL